MGCRPSRFIALCVDDRRWNPAPSGWSTDGDLALCRSRSRLRHSRRDGRSCRAIEFRFEARLGWLVHCDAIRSEVNEYAKQGAFPDPVTSLIDDERRAQFKAEGRHYREHLLHIADLSSSDARARRRSRGSSSRAAQRTTRLPARPPSSISKIVSGCSTMY